MAKKNYDVLVNITVAKHMKVEGMENEEDAKRYAQEWVADEPYYCAGSADMFIESVVVETKEVTN